MPPNNNTGAPVKDPRTDPKFIKWLESGKTVSSGAVNWLKKTPVTYPQWTQSRTLACVGFDNARQLSICVFLITGVWIDFSPASIYQPRKNSPDGGMNIEDSHDIMENRGVTLEAFMKSQGLTEAQIDAVHRSELAESIAKSFANAIVKMDYVKVDMQSIAQVIENNRAVGLLIYSNEEEYSRKTPVVLDSNLTYENATIRHKITAVDYFLNSNGVKRLFINDSAHFGGFAEREITENFLLNRCILADTIKEFKVDQAPIVVPPKAPLFNFQVSMKFGDRSPEVVKLQEMLKYEKKFPLSQESTGFYGSITAASVLAWQLENVATIAASELRRLGGKWFGLESRLAANKKFNVSASPSFPDTGDLDVPTIPYDGIS